MAKGDKKASKAARKEHRQNINEVLEDVAFEQSGFLEKEHENEKITQHDIIEQVDMFSAQKYFELNLDKFGPYRINYTRNGRNLLIGGRKGHVASFDWQTKKLNCEINVMETVTDVKWLHIETMFAVSQKKWTYIYDNQGIELHCLKVLDRVTRLEFLPYHFLLASINEAGYLSYVDVSIGKKVAGFSTAHGRCEIMAQNPANAVVHLGHSNGVVTLWSPNVKEPLVKMLCHKSALKSIAINQNGNYMITSGLDHLLNVWDLRTYKQLGAIKLNGGASNLAFSQKNLIAASIRNEVQIYNNVLHEPQSDEITVQPLTGSMVYMNHTTRGLINGIQFCPYEDVLGIGYSSGFSSILVPGAGEPNFDALEANPYESKSQRKQWEVKALLEKIQPELINLDPFKLRQIDQKTLQEKLIERNKIHFLKPRKVDFEPKNKMKGKGKTGRVEARKKAVKGAVLKEFVKEVAELKHKQAASEEKNNEIVKVVDKPYSVFDRFKKKKN